MDSSEDPTRYRLRNGASIKDTVFQMWARGQRFLHHTARNRLKEYIVISVSVCEFGQASAAPSTDGVSFAELIARALNGIWGPMTFEDCIGRKGFGPSVLKP